MFFFFGLVTVAAGLTMVITRNIVHAMFLLFVVLFGMAGVYVFAGAEFIAVSQVIIYVGGILIILLFGVMLTHKLRELTPQTDTLNFIPGLLVGVGMLAGFIFLIQRSGIKEILEARALNAAPAPMPSTLGMIGVQTITEYLLPFEAISILLLVALIGAAYLSRKRKEAEI